MTCVLYALWRDAPIFPLKNIENICLSCWTERTLHNASRETIGRARHLFRYPYFMIKWLWIAVHKLIASLFGICRVIGNRGWTCGLTQQRTSVLTLFYDYCSDTGRLESSPNQFSGFEMIAIQVYNKKQSCCSELLLKKKQMYVCMHVLIIY